MKPFKAQCNEVKRKSYERFSYDRKREETVAYEVKELRCEEQIWFEPSLKTGVFVGRCPVATHNPVYRQVK